MIRAFKAVGDAARVAGRAPLETGIGAASLPFMTKELAGGKGAVKKERVRRGATSAAQRIGMTKVTHKLKIAYSEEELRVLKKTAQVLEKQSARVMKFRKATAGLARKAQSLRKALADKARSSSKKSPRLQISGFQDALKKLAPYVAVGGGLGAAGAVLGVGQEGLRTGMGRLGEALRARSREKRFAQVLDADPGLRDVPQARTMFGVLDRASPYLASEPILAAGTLRTMVETAPVMGSVAPQGDLPGLGPEMARQLLNVEESRQKTRFPGVKASKTTPPIPFPGADFGSGS